MKTETFTRKEILKLIFELLCNLSKVQSYHIKFVGKYDKIEISGYTKDNE